MAHLSGNHATLLNPTPIRALTHYHNDDGMRLLDGSFRILLSGGPGSECHRSRVCSPADMGARRSCRDPQQDAVAIDDENLTVGAGP
jgi:hypothetical protein